MDEVIFLKCFLVHNTSYGCHQTNLGIAIHFEVFFCLQSKLAPVSVGQVFEKIFADDSDFRISASVLIIFVMKLVATDSTGRCHNGVFKN